MNSYNDKIFRMANSGIYYEKSISVIYSHNFITDVILGVFYGKAGRLNHITFAIKESYDTSI